MAAAILKEVTLAKADKYEIVQSNVFFPPESVNWQYFTKSDKRATSPGIGEAVFYDIKVGDLVEKDAAWSYPEPKAAVKHIKDYVVFGYGQVHLKTERVE
ncbi:MAG: DUF427 domain-containing protein [Chloroflexota bacterium]|nr:MAG: DUF427 domain-containing protein [Chloroflexota bacterium]